MKESIEERLKELEYSTKRNNIRVYVNANNHQLSGIWRFERIEFWIDGRLMVCCSRGRGCPWFHISKISFIHKSMEGQE